MEEGASSRLGLIEKAKKNLMRTTPMASISRLITIYIKEQDDDDHDGNHHIVIGFFGIVTDDDDDDDYTTTTTRPMPMPRPRGVNIDDEVIPFPSPLKVIALSFTKSARSRIQKAGGKCLSFRQLPLSFHKNSLFTFSKHHNSLVIIKPKSNHNNNNIIKGCSSSSSSRSNQTTMRNVRRRIQGAFMDNLNDDLLCEILIRLPAKTLGGLKVINKRWYSFISHPSFVSKHTTSLLQTEARGGHSTFISQSYHSRTTLLSFDCPSPNLFSEKTFTLSLPPDNPCMPTIYPEPTFYASGRGLLIAETDYHTYICNPLTKKYKCIPFPTKTLYFSSGLIFGGSTSSGDQYDHNHYTLVCLVEVHKAFKFMIFMPKERHWRDSNKSSWISHRSNWSEMFCIRDTVPVCHGRIMHWLTQQGYIVAFNLDKEESRLIEIPKTALTVEVNQFWRKCAWLGVLEGEIIFVVGTSKHEIVTWVLHDYENNKWKIKRKDVINPGSVPVNYIRPVFFDGRRFLFTISTTMLYNNPFFYCHFLMEHDVRTGVSKPLHSECSLSFGGSLQCVPITSTLIEV